MSCSKDDALRTSFHLTCALNFIIKKNKNLAVENRGKCLLVGKWLTAIPKKCATYNLLHENGNTVVSALTPHSFHVYTIIYNRKPRNDKFSMRIFCVALKWTQELDISSRCCNGVCYMH